MFLFAVAGGAAVGNLYWAQPLLVTIANDLQIDPSSAGLLVTFTQLGYAVGVFFVVPLGDAVDRKRVIPAVMALSTLALLGSAFAPSFIALLALLAAVGVTSVSGQLLTPLAAEISDDAHRGHNVGIVVSGILLGILVSRTVSGVISDLFGWRAVYLIAAVITAAAGLLMARSVPRLPPRPRVAYWRLLASVFPAALAHSVARTSLVLGASAMCVFTMFWTGLTLLLSAPPFSYTTTQIGLVSLVGIAGALAAQRVGRLFDRGLARPATGIGLGLTLLALVISGVGSSWISTVLIAVAIFSVGVQGTQVLLQTRMLSVDPAARSRLNTAFVVINFGGGALGSALAGVLWNVGGWTALAAGASGVITFALIVWALRREAT